MKRKMVYAGISYLVGLFFAFRFENASAFIFAAVLTAVSSLFCCLKKIKLKYFIFCFCFFAAGLSIYRTYDVFRADRIRAYSDCTVDFSGKITEKTDYSDDHTLYRLRGKINSETSADIIWYGKSENCGYGDEVSLKCTVTGFSDSYLFRQKAYYESNGIYLQVSSAEDVRFVKSSRGSAVKLIQNYRDHICRRIGYILPGTPGELITAMLTGSRSGLDDNESASLYRSGIGHVMAVSGMHLVLLTSMISLFLKRAGAGRKTEFSVIAAVTVLFAVFTGMSVSVMRSGLMVLLIYSSHLFSRRTDALNSLCISVIVLTVSGPYLISNSSFLLSAAGTFGSAVFAPFVTEHMEEDSFFRKIKKDIAYMFCVSITVFPFSLMFFDETSVVSPFSNIILMPLCEFMLICGFICAFTGGVSFIAYPVLIAGGLAGKLLVMISDLTASLSFVSVPSGPAYIPYLTAVLAVFTAVTVFKYRDGKMTAVSLAVSLIVMSISGAVYRKAESDVLNIYRLGTGKSMIYVVTKGHNADILDVSGNRKNVRYAVKALDRSGIKRAGSVVFMKNPYQSIALFDEAMKYRKADNILVPDGTYLKKGLKLCGCTPRKYGPEGFSLKYSDYEIRSENSGSFDISYSDMIISCSRDSVSVSGDNIYEENDILIRIDGSGKKEVINLDENG